MQAVILAGGKNTRVAHLYPTLPKILFPVANRIFLDTYIDTLLEEGFTDIILLTHHRSEKIEEFVNTLPLHKKKIVRVIRQRPEVGVVGAVADLEPVLEDTFFLFLGDIIFQGNLKDAEKRLDKFPVCSLISKDEFGMFEKMELLIDEKTEHIIVFERDGFSRDEGWLDNAHIYRKNFIIPLLKKYPLDQEHINKTIFPDLIKQHKLTYYKVGPILDIGTERTFLLTNTILANKDWPIRSSNLPTPLIS